MTADASRDMRLLRDMLLETPPNVGGSLAEVFPAWKAARRSGSVTSSGRRRWTVSRGWAMGLTALVSTACIRSIIPRMLPIRPVTSVTVAGSRRRRASSATRARSCSLIVMGVY